MHSLNTNLIFTMGDLNIFILNLLDLFVSYYDLIILNTLDHFVGYDLIILIINDLNVSDVNDVNDESDSNFIRGFTNGFHYDYVNFITNRCFNLI